MSEYVTKQDLLEAVDRLLGHMESMKTELLARDERDVTTLLKEFRKWAVPMNTRQKIFEATLPGIAERVTLLEDRLTELEQGREEP